MWLAQRKQKIISEEPMAEDGVVTLAGDQLGVYLQGERRGLPIYGPGGYCWHPDVGDRVLVLKLGQEGEQYCVAGTTAEAAEQLEPGEVMLRCGQASIWLKLDGSIEIIGNLKINGTAYKPCTCADVIGGDTTTGGGG